MSGCGAGMSKGLVEKKGFLFCMVPVDCEDCGGAGEGTSHGLLDVAGVVGLRAMEGLDLDNPIDADLVGWGVRDLDGGKELSRGETRAAGMVPPSPRRTRDSMALSRLPLTPLRIMALRLSSRKPMSRSWVSFLAVASGLSW